MSKKVLGRTLLLVGAVVLLLLFAWEAFAVEPLTVVEVRRNIPLDDKAAVYHDYYITGGNSEGLKHHLVVQAVRKIGVKDPSGAATVGDLDVPVAQLKIIQVGDKISVARLYKEPSRDEQPMLEQTGIMIGDRLELKGSFVDNRKPAVTTPASDEAKSVAVTTPAPTAAEPAKVEAPAAVAKTEAKQPAAADKKAEPAIPREANAAPSEDGTAP